jgi:hypothetical protein
VRYAVGGAFVSAAVHQFYQLVSAHALDKICCLLLPLLLSAAAFKPPAPEDQAASYFQWLGYLVLENTFYTGVLPVIFKQLRYLYFDRWQCMLLVLYVLVNNLTLLSTQCYSQRFKELSLLARTQGMWQPLPLADGVPVLSDAAAAGAARAVAANRMAAGGGSAGVVPAAAISISAAAVWRPQTHYAAGTLVQSEGGVLYVAAGVAGARVQPGALMPQVGTEKSLGTCTCPVPCSCLAVRCPWLEFDLPNLGAFMPQALVHLFGNPARFYLGLGSVQFATVTSQLLAILVQVLSLTSPPNTH